MRKGTYSDQVKIACLGGTVYATSILAFFSGSYAIYTVFNDNINDSISLSHWAMGFLWAVIIFNLDRFKVASTPPNTENIKFHKQIISAPFLTRIILGTIIGFVIATPLKIKIFEKDINQRVLTLKDDEILKRRQHIEKTNEAGIVQFDNKIRELDDDITEHNKQIALYGARYNKEIGGEGTGIIGIG